MATSSNCPQPQAFFNAFWPPTPAGARWPCACPIGIIFVAHGAQKLFGAFGGYGLEGTGQFMASLGLTPGYLMALLAGSAEFFGGLALLFGVLVRPAAAALAFAMLVAIFSVHIDKGLFIAKNGYEFGLALLAASVVAADQRCRPAVGGRRAGRTCQGALNERAIKPVQAGGSSP